MLCTPDDAPLSPLFAERLCFASEEGLLTPDGLTATSATPAATAPLRLGDTGRGHDRSEQRCAHGE